ncbi:MAG TPA: L,D-transpeptidase family protein [Arachidicoccus sp.]
MAQAPVAQQLGVPPALTSELLVKEDSLRNQFSRQGLLWPAREVYIRSFKYDSQMEVWVRNNTKEKFKLFRTYNVCVMAGAIGPKRIEGDYQVPEGFYYISMFNPRSEYHLSLKMNYPNESDRILSDPLKPGDGIYIHGNCVSVGCIPLQNDQIDEVYLIASAAKLNGETFVPLHVFPIKFSNRKSLVYYTKYAYDNIDLQHFTASLKPVYDYFETNKTLPLIGILKNGDYEVLN